MTILAGEMPIAPAAIRAADRVSGRIGDDHPRESPHRAHADDRDV